MPIYFHFFATYNTDLYNIGDTLILNYNIRDKVSRTSIKQGEINYLINGRQVEKQKQNRIEFIEDFYRYYDDQLLTSGSEIAKMIINEIK